MASFSTDQAWTESRARIAADAGILFPIAFALQALPSVLFQFMVLQPRMALFQQSGGTDLTALQGAWGLWGIPVGILALIGSLALILLAVRPGVSVGEALSHGTRRTVPLILASLLLGVVVGAVAFLIGVVVGLTGSLALARILALVAAVAVIFLLVRLAMIYPVAALERAGPIAILRRSWALTRGSFWKLFALLLLLLIVSVVVSLFVTSVVGIVVTPTIGGEPGSLGSLLILLAGGLAGAAVQLVGTVMLARIYLQLTDGSAERLD